MQVHRIVLERTPSVADVDAIVAGCLSMKGPFVVVVEHAKDGQFEYPTFETVMHILSRLHEHVNTIDARLVGTALCIQMDPLLRTLKDAAIRLYPPRSPCASQKTRESWKPLSRA